MVKHAQKEKEHEEKVHRFPGPMEEQLLSFVMMLAVAESSFKGIQDLLEKKGEELGEMQREERETILTPHEQDKMIEKEEKKTFTIFYINPAYEEAKAEKIESNVEIKFSSVAEEKMNESLGSKNLSPGIEYVVYPLIQDLYSKSALDEIKESENIAPIKGAEEAELVDRFVTATPERIMSAVERKEKSQKIIEEMIVKIDNAIEEVKKDKDVDKILPVLPPITRKMLEVLLKKKKKIDKKIILRILLSDRMFLERMRSVLKGLDVKSLDRIAKEIAEGIIKEIKRSL
ncbi:MAG: hypothetical protein QXY61_05195 [Candidatus Anstonellales archaeon]